MKVTVNTVNDKLHYLGYTYNTVLQCYCTTINNIHYRIYGTKPTLKGVLQQHFFKFKA